MNALFRRKSLSPEELVKSLSTPLDAINKYEQASHREDSKHPNTSLVVSPKGKRSDPNNQISPSPSPEKKPRRRNSFLLRKDAGDSKKAAKSPGKSKLGAIEHIMHQVLGTAAEKQHPPPAVNTCTDEDTIMDEDSQLVNVSPASDHEHCSTHEDSAAVLIRKMKVLLYGTDVKPRSEPKCLQLAEAIIDQRTMELLLSPVYTQLSFEARKDVVHIFRALLHRDIGGFLSYVEANACFFLTFFASGYSKHETALFCGAMLRDCFDFETLSKTFLELDLWKKLIEIVVKEKNFDISVDAFSNLYKILTNNSNKTTVMEFLVKQYDEFFCAFNTLAESDNYVTKRQALQLLSKILLEPLHFHIMIQYIACPQHLKIAMNGLRDISPLIQMEAFHVFKIFVANPRKKRRIKKILLDNRTKLLRFLSTFRVEEHDEAFQEERALLIYTLERMQSRHCQEQVKENARSSLVAGRHSSSPSFMSS